jgi:NAD(P)H-hydrate epimerase
LAHLEEHLVVLERAGQPFSYHNNGVLSDPRELHNHQSRLIAIGFIMEPSLTRQQVREFDRRAIEEYGAPGVVLMENAGRGAAEMLIALGIHGRVVVCCGKGNNGGDGFVMARHLVNHGVQVNTLAFVRPEEMKGDALINYRILERAHYPLRIMSDGDFDKLRGELDRAEWIVDALFGTGLSGPVHAPFDKIIETINAQEGRVLAVDIPSGLDCDTGKPLGLAVRACHTVTFVAAKTGFANPAAAEWLGHVHVVDIGVKLKGD